MAESLRRLGLRSDWLPEGLWARVIVLVACLVPAWSTIHGAFPGVQDSVGAGIGGSLGPMLGHMYRDRSFRRLDQPQRDIAARVQCTGIPSGNSELDDIALDRLTRQVKDNRGDSIFLPILTAALVTFTVLAAARSGGWWILAGTPMTVLLARATVVRWRHDPRPALQSLRVAMDRN